MREKVREEMVSLWELLAFRGIYPKPLRNGRRSGIYIAASAQAAYYVFFMPTQAKNGWREGGGR